MLVRVFTGAVLGVEALKISVEVDINPGIRFFIVGLAEVAIRESQQRIESALIHIGFEWPRYRIVINLAPADLRKDGSHYDLALAIGLLGASAQVSRDHLEEYVFLGELSLDGGLLPVKGVLPMALMAKREGCKGLVVPFKNLNEASVVEGLQVVGANNLSEVVGFLNRTDTELEKRKPAFMGRISGIKGPDFEELKGQEKLKRAMMIAAGGSHNLILMGPPGSGKSMSAQMLSGILPPMSQEEALETTAIYSVSGLMDSEIGLMEHRPVRCPHHSISDIALIGGGKRPRPGEISLANNGILFLDELPEFRRSVLEVLRQPLEERKIRVSRAGYRVEYPANFMLVAAMNPCPCGYLTHPKRVCQCTHMDILRYRGRISGPLLDRIDLQVEVLPVDISKMSSESSDMNSEDMLEKVRAARIMQNERFLQHPMVSANSGMDSSLRRKYCALELSGMKKLQQAINSLGLSARAYDRILKIARTIADLDGNINIREEHLVEAISYRQLDRVSQNFGT